MNLYSKQVTFIIQKTREIDNISWVFKKKEDLIIWPHFDFFHSGNADYVLSTNGVQAISTSQPYYEFLVDLNYFDI